MSILVDSNTKLCVSGITGREGTFHSRRNRDYGTDVYVRLVAHGLKSNGAEFGATTFSDLCKELEAKGKAADLDGADALLTQIESGYTQVDAARKPPEKRGHLRVTVL